MEKRVRLEGQEGAGGGPGEMAAARVTSDEERGETGARKDEGPKPDLLLAGCGLALLCLTPQTEAQAGLDCTAQAAPCAEAAAGSKAL